MTMTQTRNRLAILLASAALLAGASPALALPEKLEGPSLVGAARDDLVADVAARLRERADVNARDEVGTTALAWGVIRNNTAVVKQLLDAGADPNLVDVNGVGPLAIAVANDAREIIPLLLEKGANPNAARESGETPLMTAVRVGSPEVVRLLLARGADVNVSEKKFGQTALMWATGKAEIVRMLLDKGADGRPVTKAWEITATNYTPITFTLGVTGIPWNNDGEYKVRSGGQGALLFAVQKNDLDSVRMLLDAGLDVNQAAADGTTPLLAALYHWSTREKKKGLAFAADLRIANLLLDRGAKVNVADQAGYTPLHGALLSAVLDEREGALRLAFNPGLKCEPNRPRPKTVDDPAAVALVKRLLDAGADPNRPTVLATPGPVNVVRINPAPPGSTPFHVAAATHSPQLVKLLASRGADANRLRKDGHTPFTIAVINNDLPVVQQMVAAGADLKMRYSPIDEISDPVEANTQKRKNQSILHIAAVSGSEWVVGYLASQGAPVDARNDLGETPYDLADAQELYRFRKDSEGPVGGIEVKPEKRETQTTAALKAAMGGKLAASKPQPRTRPAG
jgi:ankyrin repeat protein